MFGLGPTELIIVAVVGLLLFGNRLPGVMRNLGVGFHAFKSEVSQVKKQVEEV